MSEQNKVFKVQKTVPGNVLFVLHPVSNPMLTKEIYLTDRRPAQFLPLDWALGVFIDNGNYALYKKGVFTFDRNEELVKEAYNAGVYFDEILDFKPVKENNEEVILAILKTGNRASIDKAIKEYGVENVKKVAIAYVDVLNTGVVRMLENIFKVQLVIDNEIIEPQQ